MQRLKYGCLLLQGVKMQIRKVQNTATDLNLIFYLFKRKKIRLKIRSFSVVLSNIEVDYIKFGNRRGTKYSL